MRWEPRYGLAATLEAGNVPRALELVSRVREIEPDNPEAPYIEAIVAANAGRMDDALELFTESTRLDESYGPAHFYRANLLIALGREADAISAFEAAAKDPRSRPHLTRAYELATDPSHLGRLRSVLEPLYAQDLDGLLALARFDLTRNELARAEAWMRTALALRPDGLDVLLVRAQLLHGQRRTQEAIRLLQELAREHPGSPRVQAALDEIQTNGGG